MSEQVDKAWLDVAREAGRRDRDAEIARLEAEIVRLEADNARLQAVLEGIVNTHQY